MAAIQISKPGSEFGPCDEDCYHKDCIESRKTASSICSICGEKIGYERYFYVTDEGYVHAVCEEER